MCVLSASDTKNTFKGDTVGDLLETFLSKIEARTAVIGVVGIGYVGLPVALGFAEAGFRVVGIDLREENVRAINEGRSHLLEIPHERVASARDKDLFSASSSFQPLTQADAVIIAVPTPLAGGSPDLSKVVFAGEEIARVLKPGSLFILESTTYPGTTEELLVPLLEAGGLKAGTDFLVAYSPERIDPGNPSYSFEDIPKVVGGMDEASTLAATALYSQVVPKVVSVSGTREAEMAKLIENTFRHVNIALVNELALYSHEMGVDIWEAIEAASSKPFGFMPFWPSPGWGGHCIPLDPAYLSWKVRQYRSHEVRFVELAQAIHSEMPRHVVERVTLLLNKQGKSINGSQILGIGVAYKGGTEDTRESAGIKILEKLSSLGADISYHDPLVPEIEFGSRTMNGLELTEELLAAQDVIVIFVPQAGTDWGLVTEASPLILDCCNALGKKGGKINRL
jgi:UDP-N-acetyl-D-glucosamine dehydrogenase